jgi:hypothetical protein
MLDGWMASKLTFRGPTLSSLWGKWLPEIKTWRWGGTYLSGEIIAVIAVLREFCVVEYLVYIAAWLSGKRRGRGRLESGLYSWAEETRIAGKGRKREWKQDQLIGIIIVEEAKKWASRYSDWLRDGRSGDRILVGGEIFCACPQRHWGPPSLLYNGYRVFPGGKVRLGRAVDHSPSSNAAVKKG